MSISVTFPEELLVASKEDRGQFTRQVMIYTWDICTNRARYRLAWAPGFWPAIAGVSIVCSQNMAFPS